MAMDRASYSVTEGDLESMVLDKRELPQEFQDHQMMREGVLDNEAMAEQGFADNTAQRFRQVGRVNGFMREFGPAFSMAVQDGTNVVAATVAHLFNDPESVHNWMHDVFLKDFEEKVGPNSRIYPLIRPTWRNRREVLSAKPCSAMVSLSNTPSRIIWWPWNSWGSSLLSNTMDSRSPSVTLYEALSIAM